MIHTKDFKPFFPFSKIRKSQRKAIKFVLNEFLQNKKKFVILEAGTGVGKSAIGVTVSRFIQNYNKQHKITNKIPDDNIVVIQNKEELQRKKEKEELKNKLNKYRFQKNSSNNNNNNNNSNNKKKQLNKDNTNESINFINSSYFLTTQKILQQQYIDDFQNRSQIIDIEDLGSIPYDMTSISSASNYKCSFYNSICCSQGRRALQYVDKKSKFYKSCSKRCKYKNNKTKFMDPNKDGVTNFSYFLNETNYARQLKPKELLVIDECHNLYLEFPEDFNDFCNKNDIVKWIRTVFLKKLNHVKSKITHKIDSEIANLDDIKDKSQLKDELLHLNEQNNSMDSDTESDINSEVNSNEINEILAKYKVKDENKTLTTLIKHNDSISKVKSTTIRFLEFYEDDNWVVNFEYEKQTVKEEIPDYEEFDEYDNYYDNKKRQEKTMKVKSIASYFTNMSSKDNENSENNENNEKDEIKIISLKKKKYRKVTKDILTKIEFKPVDISKYSKKLLYDYGYRTLLMSATILNKTKFCQLIGLKTSDVSFITLPSPFPPENKPILYCPVGNMGLSSIDDNFPKLIKNITKILKIHKKDKGIIHCHSYKISNHIIENIKSKRLLTHDSNNRDEILNRHIHSKKPTVLISPSMEEGVDLKGDKSRFQIICKIPYPYLGDQLIVKRMERWKWWYSYETIKKIVQSIGRSIRSEEDHAKTYILDKCWERFYYQNKSLFPKNFDKQFITNRKKN